MRGYNAHRVTKSGAGTKQGQRRQSLLLTLRLVSCREHYGSEYVGARYHVMSRGDWVARGERSGLWTRILKESISLWAQTETPTALLELQAAIYRSARAITKRRRRGPPSWCSTQRAGIAPPQAEGDWLSGATSDRELNAFISGPVGVVGGVPLTRAMIPWAMPAAST